MIGSGVFMCNIFFTADRFVPSVFLYILLYIPTSLQCKQSFKLVTGTILYFLLVHFVSTVSAINQFKKKKKINHVGNKAKDDPSKTSRLLMRLEQVTRSEILMMIFSET